MVKLMMFWHPGDRGLDLVEGQWLDLLDRFARSGDAQGLVRIVHNRATPIELRPISDSGRIGWRGATEFWFDTGDDLRIALDRLRTENLVTAIRADFVPVEDRLIVDTGERPLSVKVMVLWRRKAMMSREEAQHYWNCHHVRLGMEDLGLRHYLLRYFQNHVIALPWLAPEQIDGIAEFWVKDMVAFGEMGSNAERLAKIAEDEVNFMNVDQSEMLVLEESEVYRRDQTDIVWVAADTPEH